MVVLGIDPGSQRTGWGIVRDGSNRLTLVACGIVRTSSAEKSFSARLAQIYRAINATLAEHRPDAAAIEQVFTARNPQSALKLGQARGVAVAACASFGLDIFDYEPTLVKKAVVGAGRAEKEQVAFMVRKLLNMGDEHLPIDTTDALAVAICHLNHARLSFSNPDFAVKKFATKGTI